MKLVYRMFDFFCASCGEFAWSARVPDGHDPYAVRPVRCGHCEGSRFRIEETGERAA